MLMKIGGMGGIKTKTSSFTASQTAHLFLSIGNSHMIGRVLDQGEMFNAKVWQYDQSEVIIQPAEAALDHQGDDTNDLSPLLTFSDDYIVANPSIDRMVFVPYAESSSGFSDNEWAVDAIPNNLSVAVTRFNTVYAQLVSEGFTVVSVAALYHASRPDFDDNTQAQLEIDIAAMIAYLRANLTDGANIPVIIGGGMTAGQLTGRADNDINFQSTFNGVNRRIPYTWNMDMINVQDDYTAGLPVDNYDGVHADHAGELTKGHLHYNALLNAQTNDKPNDPFESLTSWPDWKAFHDFRSGTGLDVSGNANHAVQIDAVTNPALMKHDATINDLAYIRDAGGTDRYWQAGAMLGASYTKAVYVKFSSLGTQGLIQDHNDGTRMHLSAGTSVFRCYHGSSGTRVAFPSSLITLNEYQLIVLTYDASTTTMKLYLDGALMDTNTGVANHSRTVPEAIGAQTLTGTGKIGGGMVFAAYSDEVFDAAAVAALNVAAQSLLVPASETPAGITELAYWLDPSDAGVVTEASGDVSQIQNKVANGFNMVQASSSYQGNIGAVSLNSLNALQLTGGEYMKTAAFDMNNLFDATGMTIFFLKRYHSGIIEMKIESAPSNRIGFEGGNRTDAPNDTTSKLIGASTTDQWTLQVVRRTATDVSLFYNGVLEDTSSNSDINSNSNQILSIGATSSGGLSSSIDIAELLIYKRSLSISEINELGAYFATKWGVPWADI